MTGNKKRKKIVQKSNECGFMRILAIGDFHGKVPKGMKSFMKDNSFDVIICTGDLADTDKLRRMQFENWDKIKSKKNFEKLFKSKEDYASTYKEAIESMETPIKFLGNSGVKTFLIYGNADYLKKHTRKLKYKKYNSLENYINDFKNITLLQRKSVIFEDYFIVGFSGYRNYSAKKGKNKKITESWKKQLNKLLTKNRKNTILITHDVPYNTKMDKVKLKESPMYGKHVGDEIIRESIEKYQPLLHICGHMHESQGKEKIGETLIVNPGYGHDGEFALIELNGRKIDVEFYKLN